jgi:hypothetical protein
MLWYRIITVKGSEVLVNLSLYQVIGYDIYFHYGEGRFDSYLVKDSKELYNNILSFLKSVGGIGQ